MTQVKTCLGSFRSDDAWVRFPMTQVTQDWSMGALFAWVRFRFTEDANDAGFLMLGSRSVRLGSVARTCDDAQMTQMTARRVLIGRHAGFRSQ